MPLQDQILPINFSKGLETKVDPKQLNLGQLLVLENGTFIDPLEIRKRNGYSPLNFGFFPLTSGNSLATYRSGLILNDGFLSYGYSPDQQVVIPQGYKNATSISRSSIKSNIDTPAGIITMAKHSTGVELHLNNKNLTVYDPSTEQVLLFYDFTLGGVLPTFTNQIYAFDTPGGFQFFIRDTSALIHVGSVGLTIGSNVINVGFTSLGVTTGSNGCSYDVIQNSIYYYVIYTDVSSTLNIAQYIASTLTLVGSVVPIAGQVGTLSIAFDSFNSALSIIYYSEFTQYVTFTQFDLSLNQTKTPVNISLAPLNTVHRIGQAVYSQSSLFCCFENSLVDSVLTIAYPITTYGFFNFNTSVSNVNNIVYVSIYGKPFFDSLRSITYWFPNFIDFQGLFLQPQNFVLCFGDQANKAGILAKFSYNAYPMVTPGTDSILSTGAQIDQNNYAIPLYTVANTSSIAGTITFNINQNRGLMTLGTKIQSIELANNLTMTGGLTSAYDGFTTSENNFLIFPEIVGNTQQSTLGHIDGSAVGGNLYSYIAIFEFIDGQGNKVRSATSNAIEVLVNSGTTTNLINVQITTAILEEATLVLGRQEHYTIKLYRTQSTGTVYFLTNVLTNALQSYGTPYIQIVDTNSDASLNGNEQLYTTGGEVDNICPPSLSSITSFSNRVIGVNAEDPFQMYYSKQIVEGFPVEFSDSFTQNIDQRGGNITAISAMDANLIIFKPYNIFYMTGTGPAPSGANNDFSFPQIIATDVGCSNQASIVLTQIGLMFQSAKGIFLLDRSLQTQYIGAPVEAFNSFTVTSATLITGTTQVRFTLNTDIVLVYDYFMQQWSTFTNITALDAVNFEGNYTYIQSNGLTLAETPGQYTDNGTPIGLNMTLGWASFGGVNGFQRVKEFLILGESAGSTTMSVNLSYDFNSMVVQTDTIPVTAGVPIQYRIFPQIQKCESILVNISDAPTSGEGIRLSNLAFKVGVKKGPYKLPAVQNFG